MKYALALLLMVGLTGCDGQNQNVIREKMKELEREPIGTCANGRITLNGIELHYTIKVCKE